MRGTPKLTAELRRELAALPADDQIDLSDLPEMTDADWADATRFVGLHYRPAKKSVTMRLDEDLLKWFKADGKGWQTRMNRVLRMYFASHRGPRKASG